MFVYLCLLHMYPKHRGSNKVNNEYCKWDGQNQKLAHCDHRSNKCNACLLHGQLRDAIKKC